jgi:hypothetical protein
MTNSRRTEHRPGGSVWLASRLFTFGSFFLVRDRSFSSTVARFLRLFRFRPATAKSWFGDRTLNLQLTLIKSAGPWTDWSVPDTLIVRAVHSTATARLQSQRGKKGSAAAQHWMLLLGLGVTKAAPFSRGVVAVVGGALGTGHWVTHVINSPAGLFIFRPWGPRAGERVHWLCVHADCCWVRLLFPGFTSWGRKRRDWRS